MQRKAYVPGVAALLAAVLAGCTGSSGSGGPSDDSNPGSAGTATAGGPARQVPTLPEPCGAVEPRTLDNCCPASRRSTDESSARRRTRARRRSPTTPTARWAAVGRWSPPDATDHLLIDFERVVSYDNAVSDDAQAGGALRDEADGGGPPRAGGAVARTPPRPPTEAGHGPPSGAPSVRLRDPPPRPRLRLALLRLARSGSPSARRPPTSSRASWTDLGDEAFLDDELDSAGSTAQQRTVTVAFRTSNVIVTIEYAEQPTTVGAVPDSKEMQDRARKLAAELADSLSG